MKSYHFPDAGRLPVYVLKLTSPKLSNATTVYTGSRSSLLPLLPEIPAIIQKS